VDTLSRILAGAAGIVVVAVVLTSAVHTLIVPRNLRPTLVRLVFTTVRRVFNLVVRRLDTYEARDRVMAQYGPVALLTLLLTWLLMSGAGYTLIIWATSERGWRESFYSAGSSLLTLGFANPGDFPSVNAEFAAATTGIALIALLMAYLPSIYGAFSRREALVSKLAVRAGSPPSAVELLQRTHRIEWLEELGPFFAEWETWFAEIGEAHTSMASLNFFRSPRRDRSWLTAGGAVLDSASLTLAAIDVPYEPRAGLCIRSGYLALREIADFFGIPYDPDPAPGDPISIAREEFDEALARLGAIGVPLKTDRDQAWRDFTGWRVNYDAPLLALCGLTMAPYAPWSSDRSPTYRRPGRQTRR
jgi:hypothetical protein